MIHVLTLSVKSSAEIIRSNIMSFSDLIMYYVGIIEEARVKSPRLLNKN